MTDRRTIVAAVLALVTLAVYVRVIGHDFINFDDDLYVTDNLRVQQGLTWDNIKWAFIATEAANWHPLTWLSHMLDCTLFGTRPTASSVGMHHLVSALFHAANAALVFLALLKLTGAMWRSALVAAFFALHPLHVESVAWIAERKDVLSTFFGLLAITAYADYVRSSRWAQYGLLLLWFALSLLCKPMLVTLPCVLLLLDVWPLKRVRWLEPGATRQAGKNVQVRSIGFLVAEKLPLLAMSAASSWITVVVQAKAGAVQTLERIAVAARVENAAIAYVQYLAQTFWPSRMAIMYPFVLEKSTQEVAVAIGVLIVISATAMLVFRRARHVLIGWLWFLGTLVPVIGLVQVGSQARADRYTYVPLIGLFIALVWSIPVPKRGRPIAVQWWTAAAVALSVTLVVLTSIQLSHWRNSLTLFQHAVDVTTANAVAHANLGAALAHRDREDEAMTQYQIALSIKPRYSHAAKDLGSLLLKRGRVSEAITSLQRAIDAQPAYAEAHSDLGAAYFQQGRIDLSIQNLMQAIASKPDYADAHLNLAIAYQSQQRLDESIAQLREVLRIDPKHIESRVRLMQILVQRGEWVTAIKESRDILDLLPDNPGPMMSHAQMLLTVPDGPLRDVPQALALAQRASDLTGRRDVRILGVLALAQARSGDLAGATATVQAALDLAKHQSDSALTADLQRRLESYRAGKADD